ncbi:hypothetical protein LTR17_003285 [Elasticomyces elasticus]|nr:hypothetical protein LTR17_003285 [Elasticomyces elasticus]
MVTKIPSAPVGESASDSANVVDLSQQLAALDLSSGQRTPSASSSDSGEKAAKDPDEETKRAAKEAEELKAAQKTQEKAQKESAKAKAKNKAIVNIIAYFDETYGHDENKLETWQLLCVHIGIEPELSIKKCKAALREVFVNIFDFVAAQQSGRPFTRHPTANALRDYSIQNHKIFPLKKAKKSPVLRWMLIQMFFRS